MLAFGQNSSLRAKQFGSSSSKLATSIKLEKPEKSITVIILKYKDWNYCTYQKDQMPQFIHHPPTSIKPLLILVFTLNALGVANYFNQYMAASGAPPVDCKGGPNSPQHECVCQRYFT